MIFDALEKASEQFNMDVETMIRSGLLAAMFPGMEDPRLMEFILQAYRAREAEKEKAAKAQREKAEKERQAVRHDIHTIDSAVRRHH